MKKNQLILLVLMCTFAVINAQPEAISVVEIDTTTNRTNMDLKYTINALSRILDKVEKSASIVMKEEKDIADNLRRVRDITYSELKKCKDSEAATTAPTSRPLGIEPTRKPNSQH